MRFLHPADDEELELSNDGVFPTPGYFDGGSRLETNLTPPDFPGGAHPVVSANMNAVTGKRMARPWRVSVASEFCLSTGLDASQSRLPGRREPTCALSLFLSRILE